MERFILTEIGCCSKDWTNLKFEEIGDIVYGIQAAVANNTQPIGHVILTNKNINLDGTIDLKKLNYFELKTKRHFDSILKKGDLLFNWRSGSKEHVGKTALFNLDGNYTHSSFILRIRVNNEHDKWFMFFYLNYLREIGYYQKVQTYSINAKFNKSAISNMIVTVPDKPEQQRIAYILREVYFAIEQQEKLIQTTTELKKALMQKLFTEGLNGEPQMQTEIGPVPESWEVKQIGDLAAEKLQNGAFVHKPQKGNGILFANVVDMYRGIYIDFDKLERINVSLKDVSNYLLEENDILFVRSSLKREGIGQNCIIKRIKENTFFDCHLIRLKPDLTKVVPEFMSYYFDSLLGKEELIKRSKTTTMTTINQKSLSNAFIPLPKLNEQNEIASFLLKIDDKINVHIAKKQKLTDLFKTLLHELMTGQRRVHEVDFEEMETAIDSKI